MNSAQLMDSLHKLASTTSRKEKEAIMQQYKHEANFQTFFRMCFSPTINFFIAECDVSHTATSDSVDLAVVLSHLESVLATRKLTGNAARAWLDEMVRLNSQHTAHIIFKILQRDPACGVNVSTVNDTWPDLIPEWPCALASPEDSVDMDELEWPQLAQMKMDGMRSTHHNLVFNTRSGKVVNYEHFENDLLVADLREITSKYPDIVLDGELVCFEKDGTMMTRKKSNGIINRGVKVMMTPDEWSMVTFTVWDAIDVKDFYAGHSNQTTMERFNSLKEIIKNTKSGRIKLVQHELARDRSEVDAFFKHVVANKGEGLVIKDVNAPWQGKRTKDHVKIKAFNECEMRVIDVYPGNKKSTKNKLGGVVVSDASGRLIANVGSGFNHKERDEYLKDPSLIIGKIVDVRYTELIKDTKTLKVTLYVPSYWGVRLDKNEPDDMSKLVDEVEAK